MSGLWKQIEEWKRQRADLRAHAARPQTDPRIAHEDEVTAKELGRRIMQARERVIVNERSITEIEEMIARLEDGEGSRDRSIAIRCLEDASMRLARWRWRIPPATAPKARRLPPRKSPPGRGRFRAKRRKESDGNPETPECPMD